MPTEWKKREKKMTVSKIQTPNKQKKQIIVDDQTIKIKKLLKKWVKEIYLDELDLDIEVSHIWLYRKIDLFRIELAITYTDTNGAWVGKTTSIDINIDDMKIIERDKNE